MRRPGYKVGGSYSYNAVCESCGFYYKASELQHRWDGLWVCPEDWEVRHPSDFYRNRSDVHVLPFVRSDKGDVPNPWLPTYTNLTVVLASGDTQDTAANDVGSYSLDNVSAVPKTTARVGITFLDEYGVRQVRSQSTTSSNGSTTTLTLPTTPSGAGTLSVVTRDGKFLGVASIISGNATVTLPAWTSVPNGLLFTAQYAT